MAILEKRLKKLIVLASPVSRRVFRMVEPEYYRDCDITPIY